MFIALHHFLAYRESRPRRMQSMSTQPSDDQVRAVAYSLWLAEGMPEGRAEAHWLKASEMLMAEIPDVTPKKAAPKKAVTVAKKAAPRKRS
jgi:Protein of unknown function (DUF2934)